jgi:hypothetical protein
MVLIVSLIIYWSCTIYSGIIDRIRVELLNSWSRCDDKVERDILVHTLR